jgi:hypothetical protein
MMEPARFNANHLALMAGGCLLLGEQLLKGESGVAGRRVYKTRLIRQGTRHPFVLPGLLGGEMLQLATEAGADLPQMQASAASYLDGFYKHNQVILEGAAGKVQQALIALGVEIAALAVALVVTILD